MRARLAPVVMSIDKVDPEGFQTLHAFVSGLVGGERGAYLGIIEWNRREKNARAVEVEVPPINPKLSEAEAHRPAHIERFARGIEERDFQVVDVGWRVNDVLPPGKENPRRYGQTDFPPADEWVRL